jgi:pyruvate/2-oxoglutarate dehydrogenase complex dihydrolipoamide acyltransferase (E2) component
VAEPVPILVPKAGMSMVEATVIAWHRSPGESVEAGEAIVDLETDKVELQVQAPASGVLREILVAVDEDAAVGATLGLIERSA